ncbi:hypothetical protein JQN72_05720 [Phycicoccus sp. CSK15P-2]|uniref:hypothetical protein n=1 Tax=Phycicoccus sp. CSK15P-2 TaxID=2807627 RepID=UPI001950026C|nr:hypothetical protein [Phycicoccus sp. CSK15P-2]MBM6403738.1 hypothetical protein [Phycicoccus sp. CSK15P-2]
MSESDRPTPTGDVMCAQPQPPAPVVTSLFPPRDADPETHRRWLAESPWPEVVFASALAR